MKTFFTFLVTAATALVVIPVQAQYSYGHSGPGTTRNAGVPMAPVYRPPIAAPQFKDPTQTYLYKGVEKAAPVVKFVRDCSFGALGGAAMGSLRGKPAIGLVTGCAGAWRPQQTY